MVPDTVIYSIWYLNQEIFQHLRQERIAFWRQGRESIRLSDIEGDLDGIVGRVTYYGSKTEYEIIINGKPVIVEIYNPQISKQFSQGNKVYLKLDRECVRILKDERE